MTRSAVITMVTFMRTERMVADTNCSEGIGLVMADLDLAVSTRKVTRAVATLERWAASTFIICIQKEVGYGILIGAQSLAISTDKLVTSISGTRCGRASTTGRRGRRRRCRCLCRTFATKVLTALVQNSLY
jgi:hypothetical protein